MIITASRRTDIPAFYSQWFMNRNREGFFISVNPINARQKKRVSLSPGDVDVIIFVSKNPSPLVEYLDTLDSRGYRYYYGVFNTCLHNCIYCYGNYNDRTTAINYKNHKASGPALTGGAEPGFNHMPYQGTLF